MAKRSVLKAFKKGFLLADGGNAEEARTRGYATPRAILEFPHVVRLIHQDYFRAGAGMLRALTGGATRTRLEQQGGWGNRVEEINRTAVRLAREAGAREAFVAGCVRSTGLFEGGAERARGEWEEQVSVLKEAGADLLMCESFDRLDEARLALACCKGTGLPTVVTVDIALGEEATKDGVSAGECARALIDGGADGVGAGGIREPQDMWEAALEMREAVDAPVAFVPCGYRTSSPNWESVREAVVVYGVEMAKFALQAKVAGMSLFGGGDGAGTEIIRSVAQALGCERVHIGLRPRWVGDREGVVQKA